MLEDKVGLKKLVSSKSLVLVDNCFLNTRQFDHSQILGLDFHHELKEFEPQINMALCYLRDISLELVSQNNVFVVEEVRTEFKKFKELFSAHYRFQWNRDDIIEKGFKRQYDPHGRLGRSQRRRNKKAELVQRHYHEESKEGFSQERIGLKRDYLKLFSAFTELIDSVFGHMRVYPGPSVSPSWRLPEISETDHQLVFAALGYLERYPQREVLILSHDYHLQRILDHYEINCNGMPIERETLKSRNGEVKVLYA